MRRLVWDPVSSLFSVVLTSGGFGFPNMLNEFLLMCSGWVGEVGEVD